MPNKSTRFLVMHKSNGNVWDFNDVFIICVTDYTQKYELRFTDQNIARWRSFTDKVKNVLEAIKRKF